jgi:hypothetical protein
VIFKLYVDISEAWAMSSFSQRQGLVPLEKAIQKNSMDYALRIAIWNELYDKVFNIFYNNSNKINALAKAIHIEF